MTNELNAEHEDYFKFLKDSAEEVFNLVNEMIDIKCHNCVGTESSYSAQMSEGTPKR